MQEYLTQPVFKLSSLFADEHKWGYVEKQFMELFLVISDLITFEKSVYFLYSMVFS